MLWSTASMKTGDRIVIVLLSSDDDNCGFISMSSVRMCSDVCPLDLLAKFPCRSGQSPTHSRPPLIQFFFLCITAPILCRDHSGVHHHDQWCSRSALSFTSTFSSTAPTCNDPISSSTRSIALYIALTNHVTATSTHTVFSRLAASANNIVLDGKWPKIAPRLRARNPDA